MSERENDNEEMKSPISYYGGKANLVREILPLIPEHKQYIEPFVGGASIFFAKKKSDVEVINDYDERVSNFWWVLQNDFEALQLRVRQTLHSELAHKQARSILKSGLSDKVDFAWAFWVQTNMSFSHKLFAGFAFSNSELEAQNCSNKKSDFTSQFYNRIKHTQIFNRDAIDLIKLKDREDVFMYFDPPYAESNCGHYEDKKEVYYRLLELLPTLKCKWLMSSYPSPQLEALRAECGLNYRNIEQNLSVDAVATKGKKKTECLTWNYKQPQLTLDLFKKEEKLFV